MRFYNPESYHGEVSHVNLSGKEPSPWISPDVSKALTVTLDLNMCKPAVAAGMGAPGPSSSIPARGAVAQETWQYYLHQTAVAQGRKENPSEA